MTSWLDDATGIGDPGVIQRPFSISALAARGWLPPPPTRPWIIPVEIPAPPLLSRDSCVEERIVCLKNVYNAAVKQRKLRGYVKEVSKYRGLFAAASEAMLDSRISPVLWVGWSCGVWNKNRSVPDAPPIQWTFQATRLVERRGWFRADTAGTKIRRVVHGPHLKYLIYRWAAFEAALRLARPGTQEQVTALLAAAYPRAGYTAAVAEAQAEIEEQAQDLQARLAAYEYLW